MDGIELLCGKLWHNGSPKWLLCFAEYITLQNRVSIRILLLFEINHGSEIRNGNGLRIIGSSRCLMRPLHRGAAKTGQNKSST